MVTPAQGVRGRRGCWGCGGRRWRRLSCGSGLLVQWVTSPQLRVMEAAAAAVGEVSGVHTEIRRTREGCKIRCDIHCKKRYNAKKQQ